MPGINSPDPQWSGVTPHNHTSMIDAVSPMVAPGLVPGVHCWFEPLAYARTAVKRRAQTRIVVMATTTPGTRPGATKAS